MKYKNTCLISVKTPKSTQQPQIHICKFIEKQKHKITQQKQKKKKI